MQRSERPSTAALAMASKFASMSSRERRSAQAILNNYNRSIRLWDASAATLPQNGGVSLRPYLGFADEALADFQSYEQFRAAVYARRAEIGAKVETAKQRASISRDGHGQGLTYGQRVWMVTAYNHGQGAYFQGYSAEELEPSVEMTEIEDWL